MICELSDQWIQMCVNWWTYILFVMCFSVPNFGEFRLVNVVVNVMGDVFPELKQQEVHIRDVIKEEEESFGRTLIKVRIGMCEDIFMGYQLYDSHPRLIFCYCKLDDLSLLSW